MNDAKVVFKFFAIQENANIWGLKVEHRTDEEYTFAVLDANKPRSATPLFLSSSIKETEAYVAGIARGIVMGKSKQ